MCSRHISKSKNKNIFWLGNSKMSLGWYMFLVLTWGCRKSALICNLEVGTLVQGGALT